MTVTRESDAGRRPIVVRGASEHNLKAVDVEIPRGALTVVTGVSGSGKSSLAFDTIGAEGRRRYLETFSSYARQFLGKLSRPSVTRVDGLSPAVVLDQSSLARSPRSTVGTLTELYDLLRLLWARCGRAAPGAELRLERRLFSFNAPEGACPTCKGLGVEDRLDPELLVAHPERTVREGALRITTPNGYLIYSQVTLDVLDQVCRAHGFSVDLPWNQLNAEQRDVILNGSDRIRIPYGKHPLASRLRWSGITAKPREEGTYKGILPVMEQILRQKRNRNILRFVRTLPCRECGGTRLRREALAVSVRGRSIAAVAALTIDGLLRFFEEEIGGGEGASVEQAIARQVLERGQVLQRLGLGYLTLDRESTTLSGGELQRIRLARQLGTGLGGVLYVLDEPSVGLHPEDTARLLEVLRQLRDHGNSVLIVEHDEQIVRAADWLVDVGPGAGEAGGEVLFSGPAAALLSPISGEHPGLARSRTRAFLTARERIAVPEERRPGTGELVAAGLSKHNLRGVTVTLQLGALNLVTGVSGAGKSTLVEEVVRSLREGGARLSPPGQRIDKLIEIDQSPIGRTPRSNPATYTGCFDRIRELFAAEPEALRRGHGKGRFSFNVAGGRCEACEGAGVQQIGMQFLGTVAVVCEVCGGRRFNDETLEVTCRGLRIDEVLGLSIAEAAARFADQPGIARQLDLLSDLGLGYLTLGHPATMLSGGEAQRVKLAAELARPGTGRTLYVLDEPTTGLHSADVQLLLAALEGLVAQGNTVLAIEHHLDLIKRADWVVDLGPGSGAAGGQIVASGTPERVAATEASLTGAALRDVLSGVRPVESAPRAPPATAGPIRLSNVTTHNLQHLEVEIPAGQLTVITGVSGSGKSSLAFDTLFAEGQRRFADSFTTYARRFLRLAEEGELDRASGLTPTIAIGQQAPSRNPRSSVGTVSEVHDHYRLLYARAGVRRCPRCRGGLREGRCEACGFEGLRTLSAALFSPSSERGACGGCGGLGYVLECDPTRLVTDPSRSIAAGAIAGHAPGRFYGDPHGQHMAILAAVGRARGIDFSLPWAELPEPARTIVLGGAGDELFDVVWDYQRGERRGSHRFQARWLGLSEHLREEYARKHADPRGDALLPLLARVTCPECGGGKLREELLAVRFAGLGIAELAARTVDESLAFLRELETGSALDARELAVTRELRVEVIRRLESLQDAGLGYLAIDRPVASLSGGEARRVRLATQLRSGLTGVSYVLDEPTVGLHPRDTERLIGLLRSLRDAGNTVVVVEHDLGVIAAADHLIEIGPGAGRAGGRIVAQGTPREIARDPASIMGRHLAWLEAGRPARVARELRPGIAIRGAAAHNLRQLDLEIPAGGLVVVTGVSGSGKSSLVFEVLAPSLERVLAAGGTQAPPVGCRELLAHESFARVVSVEQRSLAPSARSSVGSGIGILDPIRDLFAASDDAKARGLRRPCFSTATAGGRCEACEGLGQIKVSMDFLPDLWIPCEACGGKRFRPEVLECRILGRSIADLLELSGDEARQLFAEAALPPALAKQRVTRILAALDPLRELGLGYLRLGQPADTLSGGERQRLQLAASLLERRGAVLYLFDEPTTGLHPEDVAQLLAVFSRLIEAGHSLVVVEHNLELIRAADWVIDLGPEAGANGGELVAAGPLEAILACPRSHTGRALAL